MCRGVGTVRVALTSKFYSKHDVSYQSSRFSFLLPEETIEVSCLVS